jgi:hypothetical protein
VKKNYQHKPLQEREGASPALPSSDPAKIDDLGLPKSKRNVACRGENTADGSRENVSKHTVFVISCEGKPLTPTTPCRARKLIKSGGAVKMWSKLNTFGIKLLEKTREEIPKTVLGVDNGTKFEGYSVVCGTENLVNVKWNLPIKQNIVRKMKERAEARNARRGRLRRRKWRGYNRKRNSRWLPPSQNVIHLSRIKIISELCKIYPVKQAAIEDVKFNHRKYQWGKNFSTIEVSKQNLKDWFASRNIRITEYSGMDTKRFRTQFGLVKTSGKSEDVFTSHCSDSLAIACGTIGYKVEIGKFMVFDDTYRCIRRRLHKSQFSKGGIKKDYSKGTVKGFRKGIIIGIGDTIGVLTGLDRNYFRYLDIKDNLKRRSGSKLHWIFSGFTNTLYYSKL